MLSRDSDPPSSTARRASQSCTPRLACAATTLARGTGRMACAPRSTPAARAAVRRPIVSATTACECSAFGAVGGAEHEPWWAPAHVSVRKRQGIMEWSDRWRAAHHWTGPITADGGCAATHLVDLVERVSNRNLATRPSCGEATHQKVVRSRRTILTTRWASFVACLSSRVCDPLYLQGVAQQVFQTVRQSQPSPHVAVQ